MKVVNIEIRRKHLAAITLFPAPEKIGTGEYEGDKVLIDREILSRCSVSINTELSVEELKELIYVSECYRAKEKAVWYLSRGDLSEKALFEKLKRSFSEKAAAFALSQMVKRGYVNDRRYAENLAKKFAGQNVSARASIGKMLEKGVPLDLAKEVLQGSKGTDSERAYKLLCSKYKNKTESEDDRRRTIAALQRRGFSYSDINTALKMMWDEV